MRAQLRPSAIFMVRIDHRKKIKKKAIRAVDVGAC
jgi:hypothetical protein